MSATTTPLHSFLPVAVFIARLLNAVDSHTRALLVVVLHRFSKHTGDTFIQDPRHAGDSTNSTIELFQRLYPYALRLALRGFLTVVLEGLHGPLFDSSSSYAHTVRDLLDTYIDLATHDTRAETQLKLDPPRDAKFGCVKIWAMVSKLPTWFKFTNRSLPAESDHDAVHIQNPISWNVGGVEKFIAFSAIFLNPRFATGKSRHSMTTTAFQLNSTELAYFPKNVQCLLRAKNAFRMTKIVPPCPKGRIAMIDSQFAHVMFPTYCGGNKKSGDVVNPFGTVKGYYLKRHQHARCARQKRQRNSGAKTTSSSAAPTPTVPDKTIPVGKRMCGANPLPVAEATSLTPTDPVDPFLPVAIAQVQILPK